MVTRNRNRVELRHVHRSVSHNILNHTQRLMRRIDEGVTHHELLQNIVLNSTTEKLLLHTLFLSSNNVETHYRKHSSVHGHGDRHLVQRNTVEQDLHILNGIDSDSSHTDISSHTRMIRIISTVSSKIEGNRQTLLTGSKILTVEGIGSLSSRETSILTNGPGLLRVHGSIRTTSEREDGRSILSLNISQISLLEQRLHLNTFGGLELQST